MDQINCTLLLIQCCAVSVCCVFFIKTADRQWQPSIQVRNISLQLYSFDSIQFNFDFNWMRFNSARVYLFVSSVSTFNARFFRDFVFDFNDSSISYWNVVVWFYFDKRPKKTSRLLICKFYFRMFFSPIKIIENVNKAYKNGHSMGHLPFRQTKNRYIWMYQHKNHI